MSINLPSHYVQQYNSNIQLLLQQEGSRLKDKVMTGSHVGKQASPVDQVGAISMQPVVSRFAPMGRVDAPVDRRWVVPLDFDLPQLIDSFDKLRLLTDPNSAYVKNAVAAAGRKYDELLLAAMLGTNKTGEIGSTNTVLPTAQKILVNEGAASDTGLTVAKLKKAKRLLMKANVNVDAEPLYIAVGAEQHDNLLSEIQVISRDFNSAPVMEKGKITEFMGFQFVHTELAVATLTSGDALIPCWAKSGVYLGIWDEIKTDISQRKDLQGLPWQAYVTMTANATRLEEAKVVQIACNVE